MTNSDAPSGGYLNHYHFSNTEYSRAPLAKRCSVSKKMACHFSLWEYYMIRPRPETTTNRCYHHGRSPRVSWNPTGKCAAIGFRDARDEHFPRVVLLADSEKSGVGDNFEERASQLHYT